MGQGGGDPGVLEARDRVGGRVWSRDLPTGAVVEMGAEFILPDNSVIRTLVDRLGLRLYEKGTTYGDRDPRGGLRGGARGLRGADVRRRDDWHALMRARSGAASASRPS